MSKEIIIKNDIESNWNASTVPLRLGELGYDSVNNLLKIGNGSSLWADLPKLGAYTDAGVTSASFYGNGTQNMSINVGSAKAKKIIITCETTGTIQMNAGGIYSLHYDFVSQTGTFTYQGQTTGYIGRQDESRIDITCQEIAQTEGVMEYVYKITCGSSGTFQSGLKYNCFCITNDIPSSGVISDKNTIVGSFIGSGKPTHTWYIGTNNIKKLYITCTPHNIVSANAGSIYSAVYDFNTGEKTITYQGSDEGYIGYWSGINAFVEISDNFITAGCYIENNTEFGKFVNGAEYNWIVTTNDSVEPSVNVTDFTQMTYGTRTFSTSDVLVSANTTINVGFRPRVFAMFIQGTQRFDNNTNLKVTTAFFVADSSGNIIYAGTNFAYQQSSSSSNGNTGYTEAVKNIFYPSATGVYGGDSGNVYLKGGASYKWYALG